MDNQTILSIRDLRVVFEDGFTALGGVSIDIGENEFVTLLGPSGCGKTTLLRCIGGFEKPTSGEILYKGQNIIGLPPYKRAINTVFQRYALFPHLSVRENVAYGLRFAGVSRAEARERAQRMIEAVGLSEHADSGVQEISGGQRQRVALARSLVLGPKVLLLDEPFSNLDANLRVRMREEVRQIQREFGVTTVFVTHDRAEAMSFGDRLAIMREGRILQVATPREAYDRPADEYCAAFLGHVNELELDGARMLFRDEAVRLGAEGGLEGAVLAATYLGGSWRYDLEVAGQRIEATAPQDEAYSEGTVVPFDIARTIKF